MSVGWFRRDASKAASSSLENTVLPVKLKAAGVMRAAPGAGGVAWGGRSSSGGSLRCGSMREHSRLAQRNLRAAVASHNLDQMPGVRLIRKK